MSMTFCTLASGSKGNSYLVAGTSRRLLIDAGPSAKYLADNLCRLGVDPASIDGILVTHEHSDHIGGIRVFSKKYDIPVYANAPTMQIISQKAPELLPRNMRVFDGSFFIGEMEVVPFATPHDSICSCGYSVHCGGLKITVATDIGHMTRTVLNACENSDLLVLESNHDLQMLLEGPYPPQLKQRVQGPKGHLSNDVCGKTLAYLARRGLKQAILAHLSEKNNTPALAYETVCSVLRENGIEPGTDLGIEIADQYKHGLCYSIREPNEL